MADERRTLHACYNSDINAAYLLGAVDAEYRFQITKYSLDDMLKVGDGRQFVYASTWSDNEDYNNDLGGRVAVHRDSATNVETVYVATSQIFSNKKNLDANYVDLLKLTYTNDVQDCSSEASNCRRQKVSPYAKVLAIAPVTENICYFLLIKADNKGIARVTLISTDFTGISYSI